jgi:hypothetical protein
MIDVFTRVPSNGHGQLARESGRLTRRSKDSSTSGESGSSRCPRALAAFRDRAMPPQSIRFVFSHLDRTIVARAPPASGRSFDVREKGLQQRTSRFLSPGSVIRIRLPAQRHVGAVEGWAEPVENAPRDPALWGQPTNPWTLSCDMLEPAGGLEHSTC